MIDSSVQIKVTSAVSSSLAISSTVHRLYIRRQRFGIDDGCALFSMLTLCVQVGAVFMDLPNPAHWSKHHKVARYYLMAATFYSTIWSARLSILFSMIRIDTSVGRKKYLHIVAVAFFVAYVVLTTQLFWVCEPKPLWKDLPSPQCPLGDEVAITQLVTDILADLTLLIIPLRLLAVLRDKWLRYRLMLVFSTCVVTTIVSLVHAAYIISIGGPKVVVAALVEDAISLIVCNLPVVVASIFRLREGSRPESHRRSASGPRSKLVFASNARRSNRAGTGTGTALGGLTGLSGADMMMTTTVTVENDQFLSPDSSIPGYSVLTIKDDTETNMSLDKSRELEASRDDTKKRLSSDADIQYALQPAKSDDS